MNETIKIFTEIALLETSQLLIENGGKPVKGLAFTTRPEGTERHWETGAILRDVLLNSGSPEPIRTDKSTRPYCAKVTELDPCQAPDGCPELEPWMAYVGKGSENLAAKFGGIATKPATYWNQHGTWSQSASGCDREGNYAIDVRAEWAQEHFPEHCRIRNYQEPAKYGYHEGKLIVAPEGWEIVPEGENTPESVFFGVECGWYVTIADNGPAVVAGDESILAYARKIQGPKPIAGETGKVGEVWKLKCKFLDVNCDVLIGSSTGKEHEHFNLTHGRTCTLKNSGWPSTDNGDTLVAHSLREYFTKGTEADA